MYKEGEELSQQNIVQKAHETLQWGKDKVRSVLKKGKGTYWDCKWTGKGHKLIYAPKVFSSFRPMYNIPENQKILSQKPENTLKENQGKTLTSPEFSDFRDPLLENQEIPKDTPFNEDEDFEYDL